MIRKIAAWLAVLLIMLSVTACGESLERAIIGEWHLAEESKSVDQSAFYPEVSVLIFSEDGTWNNVKTNTYVVADGTVTMDARGLVHQYTYIVSIENDVLMLQYPGATPLYFERVK